MNDGKVGIDAISPKALPLIPQEIVDLVKQRREQMMKGEWDPFTEHEFVSNGTGLDLEGTPVPGEGYRGQAGRRKADGRMAAWFVQLRPGRHDRTGIGRQHRSRMTCERLVDRQVRLSSLGANSEMRALTSVG